MSPLFRSHELEHAPLADLLLALEATGSSFDVALESNAGEAHLSVREGKLARAKFGAKSGEAAIASMLTLPQGRYRLATPQRLSGAEQTENLGSIVRAHLGNEGHYKPQSQRRGPAINAPLDRTPEPLPRDLSPHELRSLAQINGRRTSIDIIAQDPSQPDEILAAVRRLAELGLIRVARQGTLSIGSPDKSAGDTLHSSRASQVAARGSPSGSPGAGNSFGRTLQGSVTTHVPTTPSGKSFAVQTMLGGVGVPRALVPQSPIPESPPLQNPAEALRIPQSPVPARLSGGAQHRPVGTGYSSVPPAGLAEDRVNLPRALRRQMLGIVDKASSHPPPRSGAANAASDAQNPRRTALTQEDEFGPDPDVLDAAEGQLTESELPLPSVRLSRAARHQLDELNVAVSSSRHPKLPALDEGDLSQEYLAPGSVPGSNNLPGAASTQYSASQLPIVGRYEILARLKRGGMGSVYLCRLSGNAGFRRLFAMKVLHAHLAEQTSNLDAFFHEARVLGGLHHRNVVGIADVGTPSEPYIVLDYVEGGSLAELFRATKSGRDPGLIVRIVLDALSGLGAAHAATDDTGNPLRLVHCDLTPHNILVSVDGTCRVTDFGIAQTGQYDLSDEITRGKPGYIAPERLRRTGCDLRSDLFSVGVLLYAGLAGAEPFLGNTAEAVMLNVMNHDPPLPSKVGLRPPPSLDWVCMKALAKDPNERFQSTQEMADHLRRIAEREGLLPSSSDVSTWLQAALAPTLAARRTASQRGSTTKGARYQPSTIPPPDYAPIDAPSATEHTGPLDAPASSKAFNDKTEIVESGAVAAANSPSEHAQRPPWGLYLMLAAAMLALAWTIMRPDSISVLLTGKPANPSSADQPAAENNVLPEPPTTQPTSTPAPGAGAPVVDPDRIVIPDFAPKKAKP